MKLGTISVVIPTYNREKEVVRAIKSVQEQTVSVREIIVIDDGSTDNTPSSVAKLGVRYCRISHSGLPAVARNVGMREAKGDYIAFLDSDDTWAPSKLEHQLKVLRDTGAACCATNARRYHHNHLGSVILSNPPQYPIFADLAKTNWIVASSVVAQKSALEQAGGFPENAEYKAYEDWVLWMRLSTLTDLVILDKPLVTYYDDPSVSIRSEQLHWSKIARRARTDIIRWGISRCITHPDKGRLLRDMYAAAAYLR